MVPTDLVSGEGPNPHILHDMLTSHGKGVWSLFRAPFYKDVNSIYEGCFHDLITS